MTEKPYRLNLKQSGNYNGRGELVNLTNKSYSQISLWEEEEV